MALKTDRYEFQTDISFFMNEVATRGGVVVLPSTSTPSGAAMDSAETVVTYSASLLDLLLLEFFCKIWLISTSLVNT